ncbi:Txe/YoeB family addiction module toxin [Neorhizobium alkalisoli]|uniref:Txe/YoeB family addiction module toxin n=1 Tax=Neorhizobium alkalisoli TaxID=528178 RepID=UPI000CF8A834|nr:Txe/YoeB family addiction module toxin [Neorhizobium alkalisoli]
MPPAKTFLLVWEPEAWREYIYWQETDPKIVIRINELIKDALRHPFEGIGKPEPLRNQLKGQWSRRITQEHRLVYRVEDVGEPRLVVLQCRFHY